MNSMNIRIRMAALRHSPTVQALENIISRSQERGLDVLAPCYWSLQFRFCAQDCGEEAGGKHHCDYASR